MTDRAQFEAMLEALINEDKEKAQEIFHNIVVAKSREIYEELLESDFGMDPMAGVGVEEAPAEDEEGADEFSADDATDDQIGDIEADGGDEFGGEEEGGHDEEQDERIQDLEDALEDLKAEFEQLMAGEEGGDEFGGDDMGGDDMGGDELGGELGGEEEEGFGGEEESMKPGFMEDDESLIREYVEKVGGATYDKFGKMGDDGDNTKSVVAGKNDMGGTTANIAKGGEAKGEGTTGGLANNKPQDMKTGNINVPGGNAGKTGFKKKEPGHGAEKKGTGDNGDKGASSPINGVKSRAK